MIFWPSDIPSRKHAGNKNIESTIRGYEVYIWRLTSLLISLQCKQTLRKKSLGCKDANISKRALIQVTQSLFCNQNMHEYFKLIIRLTISEHNYFSAIKTFTSALN